MPSHFIFMDKCLYLFSIKGTNRFGANVFSLFTLCYYCCYPFVKWLCRYCPNYYFRSEKHDLTFEIDYQKKKKITMTCLVQFSSSWDLIFDEGTRNIREWEEQKERARGRKWRKIERRKIRKLKNLKRMLKLF